MATNDDLCWMPASEMAPAIKRRKISPVEVMKAVLARIERLNPRLSRREPARKALQDLQTANVPALGAVLNQRTFPIPEALYKRL